MPLIDNTYFENRLIAVPNQGREQILSDLNSYIEFKEDEYLINVLGYELNKEFQAGLLEATVLQKWKDLRDGAEFTYCNKLYKWTGFVNAIKDSPIAYYTYYYYVRENNQSLQAVGVVFSQTENSNRVSPMLKLVDAWTYMVRKNRLLKMFLEVNEADYSTYDPDDSLTVSINEYGI